MVPAPVILKFFIFLDIVLHSTAEKGFFFFSSKLSAGFP
jgi:hypothetical protein